MAKPLSELRKKMSPEVQTAAHAKAIGIVTEMSQAETRKPRGRSHTIVARRIRGRSR